MINYSNHGVVEYAMNVTKNITCTLAINFHIISGMKQLIMWDSVTEYLCILIQFQMYFVPV